MKWVGMVAVALVAVTARGDHVQLTPQIAHTLTPIESVPTKAQIAGLFPDPVPQLRDLALNAAADFGVRLRAIRALPLFCPSAGSCDSAPAHLAILDVLASIDTSQRTGKSVLALRAAIEALGVARSGNPNDIDLLVPFLDNQSRDIRAATASALRDTCNTSAIVPLRARYQVEQVAQVRIAISDALRVLGQCA